MHMKEGSAADTGFTHRFKVFTKPWLVQITIHGVSDDVLHMAQCLKGIMGAILTLQVLGMRRCNLSTFEYAISIPRQVL